MKNKSSHSFSTQFSVFLMHFSRRWGKCDHHRHNGLWTLVFKIFHSSKYMYMEFCIQVKVIDPTFILGNKSSNEIVGISAVGPLYRQKLCLHFYIQHFVSRTHLAKTSHSYIFAESAINSLGNSDNCTGYITEIYLAVILH